MARKRKYRIKNIKPFNYWTMQLKQARSLWTADDPSRAKCLEIARIKKKNGFEFTCAHCLFEFIYDLVQVDHIVPVGNSQPQNRKEFFECIDKLLVDYTKLQVLCLSCHVKKTNIEAEQRREYARSS